MRKCLLLLQLLLLLATATALAEEGAVTCAGRCGQPFVTDPATGAVCGCDYWCDERGTCCGGAAAKAAACPTMVPTLNKRQLTNCRARLGAAANSSGQAYRPGMCWCDRFCRAANDCCATCSASCGASSSSIKRAAAAVDDGVVANGDEQQLIAAAVAASAKAAGAHERAGDCGVPDRETRVQQLLSAAGAVSAAAAQQAQQALLKSEIEAEALMQACQAADKGPPAKPLVARIHWTAASICGSGRCIGGRYSKALVSRQMTYLNAVYARLGIRFVWDGRIHNATASYMLEVNFAPYEGSWLCQQRRHGSSADINVMTTPLHIGGVSLGVTGLPSWFVAQDMAFPACANWIVLYEKTMPGQGGRSTVDGQLIDSGYVLAHEVGHALQLGHSFAERAGRSTTADQCNSATSLDPGAVVFEESDGVVDTPAQIPNASTPSGGMNILRFINCNTETGAYSNTSANAQQSCNSAAGFPAGDKYLNNHNNIMSYGDKSCLRTLTPGQGARARCGLKCMRQRQCF